MSCEAWLLGRGEAPGGRGEEELGIEDGGAAEGGGAVSERQLVWCEIFLDEQSYQKYRGRVKSAERAGALFECVSRGFGPLLHPFHDDGQAVLPLNTSLVQACRVFEQAPSQEIRG